MRRQHTHRFMVSPSNALFFSCARVYHSLRFERCMRHRQAARHRTHNYVSLLVCFRRTISEHIRAIDGMTWAPHRRGHRRSGQAQRWKAKVGSHMDTTRGLNSRPVGTHPTFPPFTGHNITVGSARGQAGSRSISCEKLRLCCCETYVTGWQWPRVAIVLFMRETYRPAGTQ